MGVQCVEVNVKGGAFNFTCLSDLHVDADSFNEELFEKTMKFVFDKRIHFVLNGDLIDYFFVNDISSMTENNINVNKTISKILSLLKECKKRKLLLGVVEGNHDQRIAKLTGFDFLRHLCEEDLRIPFSSSQMLVKVNTPERSWTFLVHHGWGDGRTVSAKVRRIEELCHQWENVDAIFLAHSHHPFIVPIGKRTPSGNKTVVGISSPAFIQDPEYAVKKGYPLAPFMFSYLSIVNNNLQVVSIFPS